jgi:hypothetical protein
MATNGRCGLAIGVAQVLDLLLDQEADDLGLAGMALGTATIEASVRWQVPKASLQ